MNFRIADTFTASLAKLNPQEQKIIKTTAFDLQMNPAHPGLQFHRLDRVKDPNFWSVRVNNDIRIIIHKTDANFLLCYVDHHEPAYAWAEKRKIEVHPKTGAAQIIEIRERVKEILLPAFIEEQVVRDKPLLFKDVSDEMLLNYGVPEEWLEDVHQVNEDTLLDLADHLPDEAAEALLEIATGGTPATLSFSSPGSGNPFDHPDAKRRFRLMTNKDELERALESPWEKWTIFLHPDQRELVQKNFSGPARVSGSAGTGKTVVALHRAVHLARLNSEFRILLTTFSQPLANALQGKLKLLISNMPRLGERLEVADMETIGRRLYRAQGRKLDLAPISQIKTFIEDSAKSVPDHTFSRRFLFSEWQDVVDAWQLQTWEAYRDVRRLGRKTRLPEQQRQKLWEIFSKVRLLLQEHQLTTTSEMFNTVAGKIQEQGRPPFDCIVVDEAQDVSVAQLQLLAAMGANRENGLFFAGDLGQRIFQQPFSWKALGVNILGRSRTLRINYRTSHQIRKQADLLLDPEIADVDGNQEKRSDTISVFNGPLPQIIEYADQEEETHAVAAWISQCSQKEIIPSEIGVFVRSQNEISRAVAAVNSAGLPYTILDEKIQMKSGHLSVSTMHLAKGLEFKAVVVMACDEDVIPSLQRIEAVGDDADLDEVYNTERHLLYVACTRARDHLLVTGIDPVSEFVDDLVT
ncbi:MAG: UvrD-helicase domain-containing protein [Desulfobacterales bacterium]|nr:UvrD-helicase domain-containing protein [Desulfobacterales bacterium]